jgi:ribosomal protein L37AE/L43A
VNCGECIEASHWHCPHCGQPLQGGAAPKRNGSWLENVALILAAVLTTLTVGIVVGIE